MGAFQDYARAAMAAGRKRGRRPVMNAQQFYPRGIERELQQKTAAEFMRIYRQYLEAALKGFSTFADEQLDLFDTPTELSEKFKSEIMETARKTDGKARENFSRQSELIIGAPYYPPGSAEGILNDWHATFQDLCVSACAQQKTKIAVIVAGAKQAGWNKAQLEKAIEEQLPGEFRHRAELIARTELGKLNTRCTVETYKSAGVQYYRWLTTIDGRERASHAEMNGRICSVTDGEIYFEQNPAQPLRPIEHRRTGDMYHGHPGTDFQCRCSMVMWDPEIDGDYEVKESDLIERKAAEEQAEKEAQERAEAERQAKEQAERERNERAVEKAREEARKAEAARQAAERAKEILLQANARHAARTAAQRAKIQERWDKRTRKREIFAIAEERHGKRNAAEIQARWDARRHAQEIRTIAEKRHASRDAGAIRMAWAERFRIRKEARDILKEFEGITLALKEPLEESLAKADLKQIKKRTAELRKVKTKILSWNHIENPMEAVRKYGFGEVQKAQEAIEKKFQYFAKFDIDKQVKKLEFEIDFVEKNKTYSTWELAKKAYEKGLAAAKIQKTAAAAAAKIHALEIAAKGAKDKTLTGYVNKLKKAGTPATQRELDALEKLIATAEKRAVKIRPAVPGPSDYYAETAFKESTEAQRKIKFIEGTDWKKKDAEIIDVCAKKVWQNATLEQKQAAYYYTEGSKVNNEPLYGATYQNSKKDVTEAVTKHNPNLTRLINDTAIPKNTWIRSGQDYGTFSGVFGFNLADKIKEAAAEVKKLKLQKIIKKTADVDEEVAKILTGNLQGKTGTQAAFMSTSFANNTGFKTKDLNFEIFAPKGTKCLYAEPFSKYGYRDTSPTEWDGKEKTAALGNDAEFEGILQRGTKFRILEIKWDPNGPDLEGWTIKMEIIGQEPKPYLPGNPVKY